MSLATDVERARRRSLQKRAALKQWADASGAEVDRRSLFWALVVAALVGGAVSQRVSRDQRLPRPIKRLARSAINPLSF